MIRHPEHYDVIVIGGGHAGTEATLAAARTGARTLLITHAIETLGQMSCNPAIGGIGKSHLVREIDALGGVMARATDQAGIQFRVLNARKGSAVRATRVQADRVLYRQAIRSVLEQTDGVDLFQDAAEDIQLTAGAVSGVITRTGIVFRAAAVVLTAGTFLHGKMHVGEENRSGGRMGDQAAIGLADRLRELCPRVGRLKTERRPDWMPGRWISPRCRNNGGTNPGPSCLYWAVGTSIRSSGAVGSRRPTSRLTESSERALIAHRFLAGRLKVLAPDTVQALKIKFTALPTKTRIKFLLSLKG